MLNLFVVVFVVVVRSIIQSDRSICIFKYILVCEKEMWSYLHMKMMSTSFIGKWTNGVIIGGFRKKI